MAIYLDLSFISYEVVRYDHLCDAPLAIKRDSMNSHSLLLAVCG